jgi:hypothetical protein
MFIIFEHQSSPMLKPDQNKSGNNGTVVIGYTELLYIKGKKKPAL